MRTRLILFIILWCCLSLPYASWGQQCSENPQVARLPMFGMNVPVAGGECTTSNDGQLYVAQDLWVSDEGSNNSSNQCMKYTVQTTDDITEYQLGMCDNVSDAVSFTANLRLDSTNQPGEVIDGTTKVLAGNQITNCGDDTTLHTFTLDATKVDVGVTTVWLCISASDSSKMLVSYDGVSGGRVCNGAPGSWGCYDNYVYRFKLYGCN